VRAITKLRGDYQLRKKMFCLQLVVMLCKLQYLVLYDQLDGIKMGGEYPINHTIYKQSEFFYLVVFFYLSISRLPKKLNYISKLFLEYRNHFKINCT